MRAEVLRMTLTTEWGIVGGSELGDGGGGENVGGWSTGINFVGGVEYGVAGSAPRQVESPPLICRHERGAVFLLFCRRTIRVNVADCSPDQSDKHSIRS